MSDRPIALTRQALLVADAEISLLALSRSLQHMPGSGDEALLHLSDLSSFFSSFGFKHEADVLRQLSSSLAEESGEGPAQLLLLMPDLQAIQEALLADNASGLSTARNDLAASVQRLFKPHPSSEAAAEQSKVQSGHTTAAFFDIPVDMANSQPKKSVVSTPLFPAGLMSASFAAPEAIKMGSPEVSNLTTMSDWSDIRSQAWQVLQDVGQTLHASPAQDLTQVMHKLSAASDALSRIGQKSLKEVYPYASLAPSLWVDFSVAHLLEQLYIFSERCVRITAQQRNQTLFLHWYGISLSHTETDFLGGKLAEAMGRVEKNDQGLQLILPVSLERMRLVSYRQEDQWHAVSGAQFMGWQRGIESPLPSMSLCAGFQTVTQSVQEAGEAATMNVYPWPPSVPASADVVGLALNRAGLVHILHQVHT